MLAFNTSHPLSHDAIAGFFLAVGLLLSIANWASLWTSHHRNRHASPVPLLGALALGYGLFSFPLTAPFFWIALIVDYGTLRLLLALCLLAHELWVTSSINLLHKFATKDTTRTISIELFRGKTALINFQFSPNQPCNDAGALIHSTGFLGNWTQEEDRFVITSYAENRSLELIPVEKNFQSTERNYPNKKYHYDELNDLLFIKTQ